MTTKPKKANKTEISLQIYARVRGLMPWEPKKVSLSVEGKTVRNKAGKIVNEYGFRQVFKPNSTNEQCFKTIVMPMISNVLKGFNAFLVAYGQTGSGKTFSMLGKPKLNIVGLLPRMLAYMTDQPAVTKVELCAVEAFGHHVAKIVLYDLFEEANQVKDWNLKKGNTSLTAKRAIHVDIGDAQDAHDKIVFAHGASHFAPTGKNPESSRGHVTFVSSVYQRISKHEDKVSYFVMVDCAGSEGETAFTDVFKARVDAETLMCRRLEAGTINTGLSQLQVIFNQLRVKGKLSNTIGNGLRRVLHPYINTRTYLSVLFTLSPSVNNAKATESTLKFAVTAGMVKVKPVLTKGKMNFKQLVAELKSHIDNQETVIEENNQQIEDTLREIERIKQAIERAESGMAAQESRQASKAARKMKMVKKTRIKKVKKMVTKEQLNEETGEMETVEVEVEVEEEEEYFEEEVAVAQDQDQDQDQDNNVGSAMEDEVQNAMMEVLDDASAELMNALGPEFKQQLEDDQLRSKKGGRGGRQQRTMTMEENDEAMALAIAQYSQLTVPWQKEAFLRKHKKKMEEEKAADAPLIRQASKGLLLLDEQLKQSLNDYKRLEEKQQEIELQLEDETNTIDRELLTDHAMELQIMLAEQKSVSKSLVQSKQIMIDYLRDDGREALIRFFQMKGIL